MIKMLFYVSMAAMCLIISLVLSFRGDFGNSFLFLLGSTYWFFRYQIMFKKTITDRNGNDKSA
jgi:hypothetical protein